MPNKQYTPYDDVNIILDALLVDVKEIVKEQFVGMYLYGSLANGDFDQHSDVDVLVVTRETVSESNFLELQAMHDHIATMHSPWAIQMEVTYLSQNTLLKSGSMPHLYLDRGAGEKLRWRESKSDWNVERYILREKGVVLEGPDPRALTESVSADELRRSVVDVLQLWINPLLEDPIQKIRPRGYQSFIVLSLCRMLYTLQYGEIVSKQVAAEWALKTLDSKWHRLIERAIIGRENSHLEVNPEDLNGTQDFMRYALKHSQPTLYFDVNQILHLLLAETREILHDQFVGMYLYGSLSSGDFDLETSDIDFLVVTEGILPDETVSKLEAMHNKIWASGLKWASKLEGSYIPRDLIRTHDPNGPACPTVNEAKFYLDQRGSDWIIQRHVIRECGIVLEGPDPKSLIDPVSPGDIRKSVLGVLHEWWFPMLDDPSWLRDHEAGDRAFGVITMCRALHALEHRTIVSKPKAIEWAQAKLEEPWPTLIKRASTVTNDNGQDVLLDEVLDFIRHVKDTIGSGDS
jgi:predicted nucleotidyltransferase